MRLQYGEAEEAFRAELVAWLEANAPSRELLSIPRISSADMPEFAREWQRKLFEVMSPKPDVGFLVDVSSEVAYGRRQEQTPQELADMAELYQDQVPRYRLHRLDGTLPADTLAHEIAATVWRGLR